ncbi:cytochrome c biogenesis protein CcsA [uncultured Aquimarina sp.]|uniref:cytochrome c biogenesis protein n=1 Tax=uncultured Aquimarina sp. TaxID=575652 RepID=UPI002629DAAC|nr:cytochrome c biogenesis protein CcsA [uncultured Aquimarina sp.]
MNKLYRFLSSPNLAVLLLFVFATSMAVATFVENDFGTATAWKVIYDAWWFEMVMIGLGISFFLNTFKYKLWRKEKWPILMFHLAFIIILLGAGITRYSSYGGIMRIREGASSNIIISDANYLTAKISDGTNTRMVRKKIEFSPISNNDFTINTNINGTPVKISYNNFIADAIPQVKENSPNGKPMIEMVVTAGKGRQNVFLEKGEIEAIGEHQHLVGFEVNRDDIITISEENGELFIKTPRELGNFVMATQTASTIKKDSLYPLVIRTLYRDGDASFVPMMYYPKGELELVSLADKPKDNDEIKDDAVKVDVTIGEDTETLTMLYRDGFLPTEHNTKIHNLDITLSYGAEAIKTPFALKLNDFQLERYPGSTSPSAYASEVTVLDKNNTIKMPYRIFMNNVLDYGGYRFYQASYDTDEKGTVLAVNHDVLGTAITYLGYLLMGIGMFFTLFGRKSHYASVNKKLKKLKTKAAIVGVLLLSFSSEVIAQNTPWAGNANATIEQQRIDKNHSELFGRLMVQDLDGRIKPVNTLASEFLRKLSGKPYFKLVQNEERIILDANQAFLAMHVDPNTWQDIPIIKVDLTKGGELFKNLPISDNGLVPFSGFLDNEEVYLLAEEIEKANKKKPAERSEFDKEVIKVDERFNILYNVFSGNYLKVFPNSIGDNNKWHSYSHDFEDFPPEDARFAKGIIPQYFTALLKKDYESAFESLAYIKKFQDVLGKEIIPSDKRIAAELWYNELNLNFWLFQVFFTLGFVLLLLSMVKIFKQNTGIEWIWNLTIISTLISFLLFTGNIILRWYIAQHAPWSNGYEMLVFVAWVLLLCGLLTFRKSDFALPLATLFSGTLLFVSYLDWLSPEITNLMPVLKSFWLKVHVATIVSSYAPLALSALLGFMALILIIIRTDRTKDVINVRIKELTYINEISMTMGLFVLTIGTFLGGIWANESWGRYWAWDPKETWALISVIVYAIVLHLRLIPALKSNFVLNTASVFAFWSIIMTSFGVNYYLSGLHSYAAGDPIPIPNFVYVIALLMILIAVTAYFRNKKGNYKRV